MMIMKKKYFWISLATHLFIFMNVSWISFHSAHYEKNATRTLSAYVLNARNSIQQNNEATPNQLTHKPLTIHKNSVAIRPKAQTQEIHAILQASSHEKQNVSSNQDAHKPLLNMLHEAIASQISYPDNALMLNQHGAVTIRFLLYPDGRIENITKLKSSGIDSIDNSALAAVQAIAPFKQANAFIQKPEFLSIDIVFD